MSRGKSVASLVIGGAIGLGIGILFAPKKGSETRKELKKKYKELTSSIREIDKQDIADFIEDAKAEIEIELKNLSKEKVLSVAKDKANEIRISCDELLEVARVAGNEILQDSTREFKKKTAKVLKEVIEKLEA